MNFEDAFKSIPANGWLTKPEAKLLWNCAESTKSSALEIGVYQGRSATLLGHALMNSRHHRTRDLYLCDPFWDGHHFGPETPLDPIDTIRSVSQSVQTTGVSYLLLPCTEKQLFDLWSFSKTRLGLVYIDGDHSYRGTPEALNRWAPLADVVCCHDYANKGGGLQVKRAIDDSQFVAPVTVVGRMCHCEVIV